MWGYIVAGVVTGLFIALLMLLFVFSFSPTIASLIDPVVVSFLKDVVGPVSAGFGGAVAGAYAAFYFQQKSQKDKEFQDSARTLSLAKLHYVQMLNDLTSIKKTSFLPYSAHEARFTIITYLPDSPLTEQPLDMKLIDMLMAQKAGEAINNVLLAAKKYEACFDNFKSRNRAYDDYRAVVNAAHTGKGFKTSLIELCRVVEPGRMMALFNNTEDLISYVDETIVFIANTIEEVGGILDPQFKERGVSIINIGAPPEIEMEPIAKPFFTEETLEEFLRQVRPEL